MSEEVPEAEIQEDSLRLTRWSKEEEALLIEVLDELKIAKCKTTNGGRTGIAKRMNELAVERNMKCRNFTRQMLVKYLGRNPQIEAPRREKKSTWNDIEIALFEEVMQWRDGIYRRSWTDVADRMNGIARSRKLDVRTFNGHHCANYNRKYSNTKNPIKEALDSDQAESRASHRDENNTSTVSEAETPYTTAELDLIKEISKTLDSSGTDFSWETLADQMCKLSKERGISRRQYTVDGVTEQYFLLQEEELAEEELLIP